MKLILHGENMNGTPEKLNAIGLSLNYYVDKVDYYNIKDIIIRLLANSLSFDVENMPGQIKIWVYQGE